MSSNLTGFQSGEQYSALLRTSDVYSGNMISALRSKKTERIQDEVFLEDSQTLEMCRDHEMSCYYNPKVFDCGLW